MISVLLCLATVVTGYAPLDATSLNCDGDCRTTASGQAPGHHLAACGPGWALGQRLYVGGYGIVTCGDRFGHPPHRYAVDLYFDSVYKAKLWGWHTEHTVCSLPLSASPTPPVCTREGPC